MISSLLKFNTNAPQKFKVHFFRIPSWVTRKLHGQNKSNIRESNYPTGGRVPHTLDDDTANWMIIPMHLPAPNPFYVSHWAQDAFPGSLEQKEYCMQSGHH